MSDATALVTRTQRMMMVLVFLLMVFVRLVQVRQTRPGTIVDNDADDDGVCDADEIAGCQECNSM